MYLQVGEWNRFTRVVINDKLIEGISPMKASIMLTFLTLMIAQKRLGEDEKWDWRMNLGAMAVVELLPNLKLLVN